jgi:hypothetical protein
VVSFAGIGVGRYPDSQSWLTLDFSGAAIRLWTIPLFFKVLRVDTLREVGQAGLSMVCWVGLAAMVASQVRTTLLKRIGFALVLATGLVVPVTNWDTVILGESVAISLTIGLLAAWWAFTSWPTTLTAALVSVVSLLWAFLRHVDLAVTALILILVAVSVWRSLSDRRRSRRARSRDENNGRPPRRMLGLRTVILGALVVTLAWGVPAIGKNHFNRDEVLATIFSERILPYRDRTQWFVDHGMPYGADVRALAGSFAGVHGHGSAAIRHNRRFFHWMQNHGTALYLRYLVTHPGYVVALPIRQAVPIEGATLTTVAHQPGVLAGATYGEIRAVLPDPIEALLFGGGAQLTLLAVGVGVLATFAFGIRRWTRRELVPGAAVPISLFLYWATFHGVASELGRHYVVAAVAIRVSLLVLGVLALDSLLARQQEARRSAAT